MGAFSPFFARNIRDISFFFGVPTPRVIRERKRGRKKNYHTKQTSATKTTTTTLLDDNAPRNERVLFLLLPISYSFVTASRPVFSN